MSRVMVEEEMRMTALLWDAFNDLHLAHGPLEAVAIYLIAAGVQLPINPHADALSNINRLMGDDRDEWSN